MKKISLLLLLSITVFVTSCGSKDKKEEPKKEARKFQKDYVVVDARKSIIPEWIDDPYNEDTTKAKKTNRYFISESEGNNKRLCTRSASARASARVAAEIAQFIKNTYSEATQGDEDDEVSQYMQEQLAQEVQSFIVGASVFKSYWEKRRYKMDLGAPADKTMYTCYALVKMSKRNLSKAIKNSRAKLLKSLEDPEVKKKAEKATAFVEDKFNKLEGPVQLDDAE
jgi:hypothetical protein